LGGVRRYVGEDSVRMNLDLGIREYDPIGTWKVTFFSLM